MPSASEIDLSCTDVRKLYEARIQQGNRLLKLRVCCLHCMPHPTQSKTGHTLTPKPTSPRPSTRSASPKMYENPKSPKPRPKLKQPFLFGPGPNSEISRAAKLGVLRLSWRYPCCRWWDFRCTAWVRVCTLSCTGFGVLRLKQGLVGAWCSMPGVSGLCGVLIIGLCCPEPVNFDTDPYYP